MLSTYRNNLFLLLVLLGIGSAIQAQNTLTFTESYTGGVNPTTAQRNHWTNFKASLVSGYCYTAVHFYGSNNQTGFTITDPNYVATIASNIRQGISFQIASGGHNWQYCGDDLRIDGQAVNYCSSCDNGNCLRPLSSYAGNWGGMNGATCGASSQTITLEFTYSSPTVNLGNDTTVCGDSLVLNAGNAGASFLWQDNSNDQYFTVRNTGTYYVSVSNSCGSATDTIHVTLNHAPPAPGAISGSVSVCPGSTSTYSIVAVAGATNYTWTLPATWQGSSTGTSITVTAGNNGGNLSVAAGNGCGLGNSSNLNVTVKAVSTGIDTRSACNSFTWVNGQTYTSNNNTATYTYTGSNGCDSIVTLHLTILHPTTGIDTRSACNSFTWVNGQTYTSNNNTATYTYTGSNGCDSIVTLHLTILHPSTGIDTRTACNSFTWVNGQTYTNNNNTATYTYTGSNGCDSIVTLHLTILHPSTGIDTRTACNTFTWIDGNTYTASTNSPTYTLTGSNGCDSVVSLHLTISNQVTSTITDNFCVNEGYNFNGHILTQQGTYTDTLSSAGGCDSIVTLILHSTDINDSVMMNGASLTAYQTNASYQWINCNTQQPVNGANDQTFTAVNNGTYACIIYKDNCSDTTACVNVTGLGVTALSSPQITLYPNPTNGLLTIESYLPGSCNVKVTTVQGALIKQTNLSGLQTTIDLSECLPGIYFVAVDKGEQAPTTFKILKQ